MKKLSFAITMLTLLALALLLSLPPKPLSSPEQLKNYQPNQKFLIQEKVVKETFQNKNKIYHLSNTLQLQCDINCPNYLNKKIQATAILKTYNNKNYLEILEIKKSLRFTSD